MSVLMRPPRIDPAYAPCHPIIDILFREMIKQQCPAEDLAERSGVSRTAILHLRHGAIPSIGNIQALLGVFDLEIQIVRHRLPRPYAKRGYRRRFSVPEKAHPFVKFVYEEMERRRFRLEHMAARSGVPKSTINSWRTERQPNLLNLEKVLAQLDCHYSVGIVGGWTVEQRDALMREYAEWRRQFDWDDTRRAPSICQQAPG